MRSCAVAVMALLMLVVITALGALVGVILSDLPATDAPVIRPQPIATWPYLPAEPSATAMAQPNRADPVPIDTAPEPETPTVEPVKVSAVALISTGPQFLPVVLAAPAVALVAAEVEPTSSPTPVMPTSVPTDTPTPTETATGTPEPSPTGTPTALPTATPTSTSEPTATPTETPVPVLVAPERATPIEVAPGPVASCPSGCTVQPDPSCDIIGNVNLQRDTKIYHTTGSRYYDRAKFNPAKGDLWFCTTAEAEAAGFRAPKQ